ncbi:Cytochrome b2 [Durusdinium trenchii]|uniref:Mitochondrial (L-lactate dehydrogenase [Cytochrome]) (L-lactate ferricytochrome C oxidoreductase) (L-LCR) n=1 Tax=Durusdinium trenchii TaxID=1381693 RepID=A0ABP0MXV4_9DINO
MADVVMSDEHPASRESEAFLGCGYCTEAFPEKRELEVHIKMMHEGHKYSCHPAPMPEREVGLLKKAPSMAISRNIPLSEVNRHCIPEDCWVALNGKVYDLSEFMDRHPGGPTTIVDWAGKDASKFFNDIHKGVKIESYLRPESYQGDLGLDESLMSDSFYHTLREARIDELKEELDRLLSQVSGGAKADSVQRLLQDKNVSSDLKQKLQRLETQKRAALDGEDYAKAAEIKKAVEELLSHDDHAHLHDVPLDAGSSCIPLSEVARHNKPHDCWVALNGTVYDLTDFLTQHPEQRNAILAWAGRDATAVWNKIPGRFPSANWMDFYMRPEAKMGEVGKEPEVDPKIALIRKLQDELHKLEGPSAEEIQAAKAAAQKVPGTAKEAPTEGEEARFPKLKEITAGKELPFFSRAEVAKHNTAEEPYMIIHNKVLNAVYNLKSLMGSHPGGDDILLSKAGTDATQDFEVFEHSEKARVQRDRDMLVGQLLPAEAADWTTGAGTAGAGTASASAAGGEVQRYLRYKAYDIALGAVAWYLVKTLQSRKPLSQFHGASTGDGGAISGFTYSRALRHLHLIMAVGIFGAVGTAQAAQHCEGQTKKQLLWWHKQSGLAMMAAILVRIFFRMKSGIPPRFPGHPVVKFLETSSLRLFYALAVLLPMSGMANEYFLKWAPGSETTGKDEDDRRNDRLAKQSIDAHKVLGKFLQYAFLPFHLGYTTLYHYSQGRGVVRKVSPFI